MKMAQNKITVAILSDLHIGNPRCRKDLIKQVINRCKSPKIDEIWLGGDLIEYVNKGAVGSQIMPIINEGGVKGQIEELEELLEPIKHKITKIIYGNHEQRAMRNYDPEPTRLIAAELGLKDKYISSYVDMGDFHGYKFYIEHRLRGGGGRSFSYLRTVARRLAANFPEVEIFILPHYHKFDTFPLIGIKTDKKTRTKKYFVFEGGYVEYWGSFGHKTHHEVSELGSHKIIFHLNKHKIEIKRL